VPYRVYFGYQNNEIILLLGGGDKSTQQHDIEKAKQHWQQAKDRDNAL
jgi:putative addiction module killer protein